MSKRMNDAAGMQQVKEGDAAVTERKEAGTGADLPGGASVPGGQCPPGEKLFPTEKLLRSKQMAGYQPDFARVILTEPAYSLSGAKEALVKALKGGGK